MKKIKKYKEISLDTNWSLWSEIDDYYEKLMQQKPKNKKGW